VFTPDSIHLPPTFAGNYAATSVDLVQYIPRKSVPDLAKPTVYVAFHTCWRNASVLAYVYNYAALGPLGRGVIIVFVAKL
jgi:hypothetical protein